MLRLFLIVTFLERLDLLIKRGNRLQQVDSSGETPVTITYTNDVVGMSQVLVSDDGTKTTTTLFGLDLIQQDDGSETRTLLVDGLGSARMEMVGNTIETATVYEPYGKLLAQSGSSGTVYGYTGEQYDVATSLVYLRACYYHPSLKYFQSRDPFKGYAKAPGSQHPYSYGYNNPVKYIDPSGHIACDSSNLPGIDQGACFNDQDKYSTYYPTQSSTASYIVGAGHSENAIPAELAHLDNSDVWGRFFRNATCFISEPLDWILTGWEIAKGDVSGEAAAGMVLFAALPGAQGSWGDDVAGFAARNADQVDNIVRGGAIWTPNPRAGLDPVENAYKHWVDHSSDFPQLNNALEYVEASHRFVNDPPATALIGNRSNGDMVIYDPTSNVFAVSLNDGTPRTMFIPDPSIHDYNTNLEYFYANISR